MSSEATQGSVITRIGFLLPLVLPMLVVAGHAGGGAWNFLTPLFVFFLVPLIDLLVPADTRPALSRSVPSKEWRVYFNCVLYAWVPIELSLLVWAGSAELATADPMTKAGLILSTGVVTGTIGICVAHELGHRSRRLEHGLAYVLLCCIGYVHFLVEHNEGHHITVATPDDPSTAPLGQSSWGFLPRAILGGLQDAWKIECSRLTAVRRSAWGLQNRVIRGMWIQAVLWVAIVSYAGWEALAYFVGQSAVAVVIIEVGNYVEHYGLIRGRSAGGRYEHISVRHSWNANHRLTNWLSFNLQRHSNHHCRVLRHYEALENIEAAPTLPASYPAMAVLALVPPLWRHIMDPLVERERLDTSSGSRVGSA